MEPNNQLLLNLATPALLLLLVSWALLVFSPGFRRTAKDNQPAALVLLSILSLAFALFASIAFPDPGSVVFICIIAGALLAVSSRIVLKEVETTQTRSINQPRKTRIIDKIAPSRAGKIAVWAVATFCTVGASLLISSSLGHPQGSSLYGLFGVAGAAGATFINAALYWVKTS
jgi:hypothetical protein